MFSSSFQALKLADAKHALTDVHKNARTRLPSETDGVISGSTAFHNRRDDDNRRILLLSHPHAAPCTTLHHDRSSNDPTSTSAAFRATCKRIACSTLR